MKRERITGMISIIGMVLVVVPLVDILPIYSVVMISVGIGILFGTVISLLIKVLNMLLQEKNNKR